MSVESDRFIPEALVAREGDVWVVCEWGYAGCTHGGYAEEMVWHSYSEGWMCPSCEATAQAEYDDYVWCAKYS